MLGRAYGTNLLASNKPARLDKNSNKPLDKDSNSLIAELRVRIAELEEQVLDLQQPFRQDNISARLQCADAELRFR